MAKVLWTQKQDIGPRPRVGHAMVFDVARKRVVLFGGDLLDGTKAGDTWEWDGENWTQVQDIGPSARTAHAMAHDSERGRTVLFGGNSVSGEARDTWEWDGENWTQIADTGPSKRKEHSMTFDANRKRVMLFGGDSAVSAEFFNDTWEWDGSDWVQQADSGPSPRQNAAMTYDTGRSRAVLFGGGGGGPTVFGDTWEWNGSVWTQEADFGPDACAGAAMIFNGNVAALYGGISSLAPTPPGALFSLSWEWDGKHWTARQDMGPGPRVLHAMAFDGERSRTILFGGLPVAPSDPSAASRVLGDTWEQIGEAVTTGGGGGGGTQPEGPTVEIQSVSAAPNPVSPGQTTVITVTLVNPAPAATNVALTVGGGQPAQMPFGAGASSASRNLLIPTDIAASALPMPVEVVATSGSSVASTTLTIS